MLEENSTYDQEELEKYARFAAGDPKCLDKAAKLLEVPISLSCYPNGFEAFLQDIGHYKDVIPFEAITVPALICHGTKDGDIPLS